MDPVITVKPYSQQVAGVTQVNKARPLGFVRDSCFVHVLLHAAGMCAAVF
jgi:hypothetical protein